jgi:hypothetical protein
MSKKKDRAWFVCRQWADMVSQHYASDTEVSQALKVNPRVLVKLRSGTPVAKSTLLKMLRRYSHHQDLGSAAAELVVDTRSR